MKHCFVVNPEAGKGEKKLHIIPLIEKICKKRNLDYEIYVTKAKRDAVQYVKVKAVEGEKIRFYACGGDGTLLEVANGAIGFENVEITHIPSGSGNDFVKYFGGVELFQKVENLIDGEAVEIDMIRCGDLYAINQCSMGLDAEIAMKQELFKKIPFISGHASYYSSIFYCLLKKINNIFTIKIDDEEEFTQNSLFCIAANSKWYGGGFYSAPLAEVNDGKLDFVIVKKTLGRLSLIPLISKFKAGEHLSWDITQYTKGNKLIIRSTTPAAVNLDGECFFATECTFEIVPNAMRFVLPKK
ncbi:MAG: hypothetical protein A2X64_00100 [Ignavibacteria bacterium GWF2_33_9]|nr:MAG: hypothetical protein A2X64_00100 [Ignavibacteria bacterium GWF2_33_9]